MWQRVTYYVNSWTRCIGTRYSNHGIGLRHATDRDDVVSAKDRPAVQVMLRLHAHPHFGLAHATSRSTSPFAVRSVTSSKACWSFSGCTPSMAPAAQASGRTLQPKGLGPLHDGCINECTSPSDLVPCRVPYGVAYQSELVDGGGWDPLSDLYGIIYCLFVL